LKAQTVEARRKISISKIGKKRPDLSERNRRNPPCKGRPMSGELNPMYGVKHTLESITKITENRKGKGTSPKSPETKLKMSLARKKYWENRNGN